MRRKLTKEMVEKAVASSISIAEVIRALGWTSIAGGNYATVKKHIKLYKLDTSHFLGAGWLKGKTHTFNKKRSLDDVLVIDSTYCRTQLKERLLKLKMLEVKCHTVGCAVSTAWLGRPITLHLDHINGINDDNRLENLRLLCPNCHSQTASYAGKNKGRKVKQPTVATKPAWVHPEKIVWPTKEELQKMTWITPSSLLAKQLGISDTAIKKRCRKLGISKPPRGYWAKLQANKTVGSET